MELYNEMQQWGGWPEDLLPPPLCPSFEEEPAPFKPPSSWLDPGLDDLLEVKLDLSFLEETGTLDWAPHDPEMAKPPPLPSPLTPPVDTSLYFQLDDPIADLFGQLGPPSPLKLETPPQSPSATLQRGSSALPEQFEALPDFLRESVVSSLEAPLNPNIALSPKLPPSPDMFVDIPLSPTASSVDTEEAPSSPPVPRIKPPRAQKKRAGRPCRVERKRVQNKEAATRYRIKKRAESEALSDEVETLERRNCHLKEKESDLAREIGYLKRLLEEFRARRAHK